MEKNKEIKDTRVIPPIRRIMRGSLLVHYRSKRVEDLRCGLVGVSFGGGSVERQEVVKVGEGVSGVNLIGKDLLYAKSDEGFFVYEGKRYQVVPVSRCLCVIN